MGVGGRSFLDLRIRTRRFEMRVLVVGANGKTGTRVVRSLLARNHDPIAMIRHPGQRSVFDELGVNTVLGDLEYPIDHAVIGCDALIFAAGSGSSTGKDKTILVDRLGAIRTMVAAQVHRVNRYIMLSATYVDVDSQSPIAHYHRAKAHADHYLRETELGYTIVCPGRLTDEAGRGRVSVDANINLAGQTSRDDLGTALAMCVDMDNTVGKTFSLLEGPLEVERALGSV
jgi:uncharacterized protein YbjT (DUF2867 family)